MNTAIKELHLLDALHARVKPQPLKDLKVTSDDIGKVFVLKKGEMIGQLVSRETFSTIPAADIQVWEAVTVLDVNTA